MDAFDEQDPALAMAMEAGCKEISRSMPREVMASRARLEARRFMHTHPRARLYLIDGRQQYSRAWGIDRPRARSVSKGMPRVLNQRVPSYERQLDLDDRAESHLEAVAGLFLARDYPSFKRMASRTLKTCDQSGIGKAAWSWVALHAANTGRAEEEIEAYTAMSTSRFDSLRIAGLLNGALRAEMLGMDRTSDSFSAQLAEEDKTTIARIHGLVREMNLRRHGESRLLSAERALRQQSPNGIGSDQIWSAIQ